MLNRRLFCLAAGFLAIAPALAQSGLSANSGINSADTWAVFDLTTETQAASSSITRPVITQTHHVEIGYDSGGAIVVNLWPTGTSDSVATDAEEISVVRFAGGNVTAFDQNGAPISWGALGNVPMFNPLSLLGSNPGSSVLSQLVVSDIQQQAQTMNAQLSYNGPQAQLSRSIPGNQTGSAQWTYAQSGNVWIATQVTVALNRSNVSTTRTLQFANLQWNDNASMNSARASSGSTVVNPPTPTNSTPAALTGTSSSDCVPYEADLGGTQNVVYQHGLFSDGCTWRRMVPWLNQDFRFGLELVPSLNSFDSLSNQGNALINDIDATGRGNFILIGHSQGGLVSRYAGQYLQNQNPPPPSPIVRGVVTLDTPHQGAPLAALAQGAFQDVLFGDMAAVWGDAACYSPYDNLLCYLVALQYTGMSQQLVNIGSITDLVPGSPFLTNLNSQAENFQQAAVVANTSRRWIETRVADNLIFKEAVPGRPCPTQAG